MSGVEYNLPNSGSKVEWNTTYPFVAEKWSGIQLVHFWQLSGVEYNIPILAAKWSGVQLTHFWQLSGVVYNLPISGR
jgi:hypothetical protein